MRAHRYWMKTTRVLRCGCRFGPRGQRSRNCARFLAKAAPRLVDAQLATGVDFARAVVTLGVDRGIAMFQRYGFQVRNGLAYFATPLERVRVERNARVDLLSDIDAWLDRFRGKAGPSSNAPASVTRALRGVEEAILDLCKNNRAENSQAILIALGACERALARSQSWATENVQPIFGLTLRWLRKADNRFFWKQLSSAGAKLLARSRRAAISDAEAPSPRDARR